MVTYLVFILYKSKSNKKMFRYKLKNKIFIEELIRFAQILRNRRYPVSQRWRLGK